MLLLCLFSYKIACCRGLLPRLARSTKFPIPFLSSLHHHCKLVPSAVDDHSKPVNPSGIIPPNILLLPSPANPIQPNPTSLPHPFIPLIPSSSLSPFSSQLTSIHSSSRGEQWPVVPLHFMAQMLLT
jgi:hypothetical protein